MVVASLAWFEKCLTEALKVFPEFGRRRENNPKEEMGEANGVGSGNGPKDVPSICKSTTDGDASHFVTPRIKYQHSAE